MEEKLKGQVTELDYGKSIKLDLKDRKILAALSFNARLSSAFLAKIIGLSKDAIRYRINNLKKKDVLRGNVIILNPFKFGIQPYTILLRLGRIAEEEEQNLIKFFLGHPFVMWFAQCSGQWDFIIDVAAKDIRHFDFMLKDIKTRCGNYLKNYETLNIIGLYKYENLSESFRKEAGIELKFEKKDLSFSRDLKKPKAELDGSIEVLDRQDMAVLKLLSIDCTMPLMDIAGKIGLSADAVKYRIEKMINRNVLLAFNPIINVSYLHYHVYILFFQTIPNLSNERRKEFVNFLISHQDVDFVLPAIGKWDFEIYMAAKDPVRFNNVLKEIRNRFSDALADHDHLMVLKDYRFTFLPEGFLAE